MNNTSVIVFGPPLSRTNNGYGGGQGGIVSAISRMINYFDKQEISYVYSEYSVRSFSKYWYLQLPYRLVCDLVKLLKVCLNRRGKTIAHIVADGGLAAYRSLFAILMAKIFGIMVITDVRGNGLGAFAESRESFLGDLIWKLIIKNSQYVLVQRQTTIAHLPESYKSKILLHPNWISVDSCYERQGSILIDSRLRAVFVGYCFADKGVYEIVKGCELAAKHGVDIELHLIGAESPEFTSFIEKRRNSNLFPIIRHGKVAQGEVRVLMKSFDVFVFPSSFKSEGHPNVINEAMFAKLAIITSDVGAISEILDDLTAYFVPPRSPEAISERLIEIHLNRGKAREKADAAFFKVREHYSESNVLGSLLSIYARNC